MRHNEYEAIEILRILYQSPNSSELLSGHVLTVIMDILDCSDRHRDTVFELMFMYFSRSQYQTLSSEFAAARVVLRIVCTNTVPYKDPLKELVFWRNLVNNGFAMPLPTYIGQL